MSSSTSEHEQAVANFLRENYNFADNEEQRKAIRAEEENDDDDEEEEEFSDDEDEDEEEKEYECASTADLTEHTAAAANIKYDHDEENSEEEDSEEEDDTDDEAELHDHDNVDYEEGEDNDTDGLPLVRSKEDQAAIDREREQKNKEAMACLGELASKPLVYRPEEITSAAASGNDDYNDDDDDDEAMNDKNDEVKQQQPISEHDNEAEEKEDDDDDMDDDLSKEEDRYYAVRKGKSATACIFIYWEDCWEQIGGFEEAEYEGFVDMEAAVEYVRFYKMEEKASAAKSKKRKDAEGTEGEATKVDSSTLVAKEATTEKFPEVSGFEQTTKKRGRGRPRKHKLPHSKKKKPSKSALKWNRMFDELIKFKEENGDCIVPTSKQSPNIHLSRWVTAQRKNYKDLQNGNPSSMTREMFDKLTEIGFVFKPYEARREKKARLRQESAEDDRKDRKYLSWEMRLEDLEKYKQEHGDCNVPINHGSLGRWVRAIRYQVKHFRSGKDVPTMTPERIAALENLGFVFEAKKVKKPKDKTTKRVRKSYKPKVPRGADWEKMYVQLRDYWRTHGTSMVKCHPYTPLRGWMVKQREQYHLLREGKPSTMTAERIQRLNDIDFPFTSTKNNFTWEERYEQLKQYKAEYGHVVVPRYSTEYIGLGKWVQQQRGKYKHKMEGKYSNLSDERVRLLEELGMAWSVLKKCKDRAERLPWNTRFQQLLQFKKDYGHTVVPQHYPELGNWVHQQRVHYKLMKKGRESLMTSQKALQLADIGFVFEVKGRKPKAAIEEQQLQSNPPRVSWDTGGWNSRQFLSQGLEF